MGLMPLCYIGILLTYAEPYRQPIWFVIYQCVTAGLAFALGKLWKDKGFWFFAAFLLLLGIRTWVKAPGALFYLPVSESMVTGVWVATACYGLGRIADEKQIKTLLRIMAAVWTTWVVVYSLIGIYSAWNEIRVYNLVHAGYWDLYAKRLRLIVTVNAGAAVVSFSALVATFAGLSAKKTIVRILYFLSLIPILLALCLTDARTSQITFALGVSGAVYLNYLRGRIGNEESRTRKWLGQIGAILITGILFIGILFVLTKVISVYNHFKVQGSILISSAYAEESGKTVTQILNRGFSLGGLLSGRDEIWKCVIRYMNQNKRVWLFGESLYLPMTGPNQLIGYPMAHCHNTIIQILLVSGIPGLLLIIGFLACVGKQMIRKLRDNRKQSFIVFICMIILALLPGEIVECFLTFESGNMPMLPAVFISMGIISSKVER